MEKFKQNKDCLEELLNTGSMELIEDTTGWHDNTKGMAKNDDWILHSICVGNTAGVIAKALNLDEEYAKVLGYIHDIGKRFGLNSHEGVIPHAINGYNYLKKLGYSE